MNSRGRYSVRMDMPRCYLICANARCGSTLLSRALSDTGLAGHPEEYFVTGPPEAFSPGSTFWEVGVLARHYRVDGRGEFLLLVYRVFDAQRRLRGQAHVELRPVDDREVSRAPTIQAIHHGGDLHSRISRGPVRSL